MSDKKTRLLDYAFWLWLALFRPKAFLFLYGDKRR